MSSKLRAIDPKFVDLCPADLKHGDGALLEACWNLVKARVHEIEELFTFVAEEFQPNKRSEMRPGYYREAVSGTEIISIRNEGEKVMLFLILEKDLTFAVGVQSSPRGYCTYLERKPNAWKVANFKDLIRALDGKLTHARRKQAEEYREQQIDAINLLRRKEAVLA